MAVLPAKLCFGSNSADAAPGKGRNEVRGVAAEIDATSFAILSATPHWRRLLSNFAPTPFVYNGRSWGTVEHAFQAEKFAFNAGVYESFTLGHGLGNADGNAARAARKMIVLTPLECALWDARKDGVMEALWRAKFIQNKNVREILKHTGKAELWHVAPRMMPVRWLALEALRTELCEGVVIV